MLQMFLIHKKIQLPKLLSARKKKKSSETGQGLGDYRKTIRTLTCFQLSTRKQNTV